MKCLCVKELKTLEGRKGETRVVTKFLLFPKKLGNTIKWLGHAKIKQRVCERDVGGSMDWSTKLKWCDIEWMD